MNVGAENGLYFIDDEFKIIYYNSAVKEMYPDITTGMYCYKFLAGRQSVCTHCPLARSERKSTFFNAQRGEYIYASVADAELPSFGNVHCVTFSRVEESDYKTSDGELPQKSEFYDIVSDGDHIGMIGGYCESGFPLFFANSKIISMLGYNDYDDFCKGINGLVANTIHPDDMAQVMSDIGPSYYVGLEYTTTYRMPKKDGSWFWVVDNGRVVKAENDRLAIVSFCTDMTDSINAQKRLEHQNKLLREQNKFMEFINDGMPGSYFRCIAKEGVPIVYMSDKFIDLLGFTREELKEKYDNKFINLVHPDDLPYIDSELAEADYQGNCDISLHYRIATKNGWIQVADNTRLSEYDGEKYYQCIILNIDDEESVKDHAESIGSVQKVLSEALTREQDYRTQLSTMQNEVLGAISCGVIAYTLPEREVLSVNNAAKRLIGCAPDEDPMKALLIFLSERVLPEDREAIAQARTRLQKAGDVISQDYRADINGNIINLHSNIKYLEKSNGKPYFLITLLDTTELQKRNEQLRNVLSMQTDITESLGSGIFAYTVPDHNVIILNQEAKKMFDCMGSDKTRYGLDIINKIHPDDLPAVREAAKSLKKPNDCAEYVFHCDTEAFGRRTYKCSTKLLSFVDGNKYILSSINDITKHELTEKRLDEERMRYRNALALGSKFFFTIDLSVGIVENQVISFDGTDIFEKTGITLPAKYDDVAGAWLASSKVISPSEAADIICSRDKLIEFYESGSTIMEFEYQVTENNTYYRTLALVYKSEEHVKISFIVYDISENRQEEKQRRAIINSIGEIYSALYHCSLVRDGFTPLKVEDDIADRLTEGITFSEFRKMYTEDYILPEHRQLAADFLDPDSIRRALADTNYISGEFKRRNLGWCRINLVASGRDKNGTVTSVVFAGYAIEDQKQAELAQREALKTAYEATKHANAAKTSFLANMSHDIRTPMNAIIGMTAIAETHLDDKERLSDCLSKISVSSKHLLGLINEVLDMSKIESGKMELREEEFNLPDLIDNLITMSKPGITAKNHKLSVSIKSIRHEAVIGDSQRIQQVFMNLMSNAVKYTPEGGKISLSITEKPTRTQQIGCYEFIFADNGIGMSEEFLKHLFEPFARAEDDAQVSKVQGTGLGMSITKNIVQMMNGDIKVESKKGEGTRFTVTFFLKLHNTEHTADHERFAGLAVLVTDGNEESRADTCEILGELGFLCECASSNDDAVQKAIQRHSESRDYFAVILDHSAPENDGVDAAGKIRRQTAKKVPFVIISSDDYSEIELEARAAGADAFIAKPHFMSRMAHMFEELTGGSAGDKPEHNLNELAGDNFTGRRALLVEDNPLNSEIAGEILRMVGLEVEFASNGKEALDIMTDIADDYFSIVFMDIQMPIMNGYEATRAIRSLPRGYTKSVPIIAMTANAFAEDVTAAKNAGMNEHIAKPLDLQQLHRTLIKWVK